MTDAKQLLALSPILCVPDVPQAIQYYQETLGFQKDWDYGTPALYASVSRDGLALHLRHADFPLHSSGRSADIVDFYFLAANVDLLYSEMFGRGAKVVYGPTKQDYGMKEFYLEDCHGYRLGFGQPI